MARPANRDRLQKIYQAVDRHPGEKPAFLAGLLGLHRSDVTRALPALEEKGLYISEDERGGLWNFRRPK